MHCKMCFLSTPFPFVRVRCLPSFFQPVVAPAVYYSHEEMKCDAISTAWDVYVCRSWAVCTQVQFDGYVACTPG